MPSLFSQKTLPKAAVTRLRSAHAFKAMLRDSLNLHAPATPSVPAPTVPEPPSTADDDDLMSLDWPLSRDSSEDTGLDRAPSARRPRCDSAATVTPSTVAHTRPSSPRPGKKKSKRALKRSASSRSLRPDPGAPDDSEQDWSADMPALVFTAEPAFPSAADLAHIRALLAQEAYAARMLDGLYDTAAAGAGAGARGRQRFDVSLNFQTRHVELWDVADSETVHVVEGLVYVKDARPYALGSPLDLPVQSLAIDWRTVESDCKKARITDTVLYATSLGLPNDPPPPPPSLQHRVAAPSAAGRGLYAGRQWEWVAPGTAGTCRGGGWVMRFWVPVPLALVRGRAGGVASFVHAGVSLIDEEQDELVTLHAQTTVTLECLRRARDMPLSGRL